MAHGTAAAPGGAYAEVLEERLKLRWARAKFATWRRGRSVLDRSIAAIRSGFFSDSTAGTNAKMLIGDATFSATGIGRPAAPTTELRRRFIATLRAPWNEDVDEHRSTKCCSTCSGVLDHVYAPTPKRIYERRQAPLPHGWTRPPARPIKPWRKVRGMQRCPGDECRAHSYKHRDFDAARFQLDNALSKERGEGTLPAMQRFRRVGEAPAAVFFLWR